MPSDAADFVIIGGGTAGLALAARISEESHHVVVLEAGEHKPQDPRVVTPALWPGLVGTDADWNFLTVPQESLNGKQLPIPHGRILGGSSAVNGMAFVATSRANIDAWGALGNPGWDWKTLEPYYRKVYTLTLPSEQKQNEFGLGYIDQEIEANGPVQASFPDAIHDPVASAWIEALKELGYPMIGDPFSGNAYGGYTNAATIDPVTKTRSYSANAYYEPVQSRTNLEVVTGALVEKIIFEKQGDKTIAIGVQYTKNGISTVLKATGEVILSAGCFNSPKILELSGVGISSILESHSIPVIVASEGVGENLQDHVLAGMSFEVRDAIVTKDDLMRKDPSALGTAMANYKEKKFGPFTVGGNYSSALLPLPDFKADSTKAELTALLDSVSIPASDSYEDDLWKFVKSILQNPREASGGFFTYPAQADFKGSGVGEEVLRTKLPENYITIAVSLLHPLSRGNTHIQSKDPEQSPKIDPRYLTHPLDLELLARHTRFIDSIASAQSLTRILKPQGKRSPGVAPDLRKIPLEEVKDYVRGAAKSTWHPTGTCSMMPKHKGGVVDARLKVYGVENLRVVDASVIPIVTRGNSQSSVYAIAERASDLIKEDWAKASGT